VPCGKAGRQTGTSLVLNGFPALAMEQAGNGARLDESEAA
jgi:hypothetical protein